MELKDIPAIHHSVLLEEVIAYLRPHDGGIYVDGNLGLGGHSGRILECSGPSGRVIGFEWDIEALSLAQERLRSYGDRLTVVRRNFATIKASLQELGIGQVDGLLLDLGLSSLQLDESGRGFSFKGSEPLDMRMDERLAETAADLLNTATLEELEDIFYYFGEERQARPIAALVVEERQRIATTDALVAIVERAIPRRFHPKNIHVATKTFQGLRIAVNQELHNLEAVLRDGVGLLKPGASFCVISFHSLEDRQVKKVFREHPDLWVVTKKPVIAGAEELRLNPRARSAKLRVARREVER
jgi:16S rRNA (cytosine1402-N4)-methyltransferase